MLTRICLVVFGFALGMFAADGPIAAYGHPEVLAAMFVLLGAALLLRLFD